MSADAEEEISNRNEQRLPGAALTLWIVMLLACPYPGFLGNAALRLIDVAMVSVGAFIVLLLSWRDPHRLTRLPSSVLAILVALAFLAAWEFLVAALISRQGVSGFFDMYRQVLFSVALLVGYLGGRDGAAPDARRALIIVLLINTAAWAAQLAMPGLPHRIFSGRSDVMMASQLEFRGIGTLGNPTALAVLGGALAVTFIEDYRRSGRAASILAALLACGAVLASQSRTGLALLGALVVGLYAYHFRPRMRFRPVPLARLALLAFVAGVTMAGFAWAARERLWYLVSGITVVTESGLLAQSSFAARVLIWSDLLQGLDGAWLTGVGRTEVLGGNTFADNNYIFTLSRYGLIGLGLLMTSVMVGFVGAARRTASWVGTAAMLLWVSLLASSLTMDALEHFRLGSLAFTLTGAALARPASRARFGKLIRQEYA